MTLEKYSTPNSGKKLSDSPFIAEIFEAAHKSALIEAPPAMAKTGVDTDSFQLKVAKRMIAELEKERQSLEKQVQLLQAAVEYSNDGISISDMRTEGTPIIYASPKLEELSGYRADELIGSNWRILYKAEPDEEAQKRLKQAFAKGEECEVSVRNIKKDGTPFMSRVTLYPLTAIDGEVTHYVSVIQDETEKRKTAQALRQAQRLDSIGLMAGGIVHDFNNVLQSVLTQVSIVGRKLEAEHPAEKNVLSIHRAANRAADLTQQLLKYAREEEFDMEVLDIKELVEETVALITSTLSTEVVLDRSYQESDLKIQSFKGQVQQILINLILNASESIEDRGEIQISCRSVVAGNKHQISGVTDGRYLSNALDLDRKYLVVEVSDNGCGMPLETIESIFDPFYTTKSTGNGLGLAVTLGAVQSQKGALEVVSQPDVGSKFSVYFPHIEEE